ncbi:Hypothetical protein A7982_09065 [Minicystis rosea]|nr:Hypothetical protein A7982_09065 [Minicystis rosea]
MSDDRDKKEDPAEELKQGLTHLWRAARGVAAGVKKEVDRTDFGKAIDDAGREFVRAAANVVDRIAVEVDQLTKPGDAPPRGEGVQAPEAQEKPEEKHDEDDEFDGVKPREKGSAPQDPGFRIAVDDDAEKKKPE